MQYQIVNILDSVLGPHKSYAKSEYYYSCPFCHHYNPKLAVNLQKKKWHCWKCGKQGGTLLSLFRRLDVTKEQMHQLRTLLEDEIPTAKLDLGEKIPLVLPSEFIPLSEPSKLLERTKALAYLTKRGITEDDILLHNIGYCPEGMYKHRLIIPSYDESGSLNFFVGRDYHGFSYLKYMNPPVSKNIVGFENHINWDYPIVICEGVFDAMAIKRNAVPQLGTHLPKKLQKRILQQGVKEVYLALDDDALKDTIRIAERFMKEGLTVYLVDLDGHDPSEMGFLEMQHRIKNATKLKFVDLVQLKLRLSL